MSAPAMHEELDVVLFSAGGWRVGFEAQRVRGAQPASGEVQDGKIEAQLGLPPNTESRTLAHWLAIKQAAGEGDLELLVSGPVELTALPVADVHPLPPLLAARSSLRGLRALVLNETVAKAAVLLFATAGLGGD